MLRVISDQARHQNPQVERGRLDAPPLHSTPGARPVSRISEPTAARDGQQMHSRAISEPSMRRCPHDPIEAVFAAAELLSEAVTADLAGDEAGARSLLTRADRADVRAWVTPILGTMPKFKLLPQSPPMLPRDQRPLPRMPDAVTRRAVLDRDGYHCRFCGIPVVTAETRAAIRTKYGLALQWEGTFETQHAAFLCCWLQFDHVLPNGRGGVSDPDNVVIACAPCNYGRMHFTLEEAGMADPRSCESQPRWRGHASWNGLQEFHRR